MQLLSILIVEDETVLAGHLLDVLQENGFADVRVATCVAEAKEAVAERCPKLVLLDGMLPDGDGFDLLAAWRAAGLAMPVVMLTARDDGAARIEGLSLGADDYISKPFLKEELLLRIQAVLRRTYPASTGRRVRLAHATVFLDSGEVRRNDGQVVALTAKEYALFEKLASEMGRIVTSDALQLALWDDLLVGGDNTLMVTVRRLRAKIEDDPSQPQNLVTVRGLGYKLLGQWQ